MCLLLNATHRLLVATAHITVKGLLMLDINNSIALAKLRTGAFQNILVKCLFLFVERAVDTINLVAQQHIDIGALFNLLQTFVIGFTERREGRHKLVKSFRHIAVVPKRLRFHALGFERDCMIFYHF